MSTSSKLTIRESKVLVYRTQADIATDIANGTLANGSYIAQANDTGGISSITNGIMAPLNVTFVNLAAFQAAVAAGLPAGVYDVGGKPWNLDANGNYEPANKPQGWKPVCNIAWTSGWNNPTFTPAASNKGVPVQLEAVATPNFDGQDLIFPANEGDEVKVTWAIGVTTPSGSGLNVFCFSLGGDSFINIVDGTGGLLASTPFVTVPPNYTPSQAYVATQTFKVSKKMLNANSMVVLRFYGGNATTGSFSYGINTSDGGNGCVIAENLRADNDNYAALVSQQTLYPTGVPGANLTRTLQDYTATTITSANGLLDTSGNLDIVYNNCAIGDIIVVEADFKTNQAYQDYMLASTGGSINKTWNVGSFRSTIQAMFLNDQPNLQLNSTIGNRLHCFWINRVSPSDLYSTSVDTNGKTVGSVKLQLFGASWTSGAPVSVTISGANSNSVNGFSFIKATKYQSEVIYSVYPPYTSQGTALLTNRLQEPATLKNPTSGQYQMLMHAGSPDGGWLATSSSPNKNWVVQGTAPILPGFTETGSIVDGNNIYIYAGISLYVAYGTDMASLTIQSTSVLANPSLFSTCNNVGGCKANGVYLLWVDGVIGGVYGTYLLSSKSPISGFALVGMITMNPTVDWATGGPFPGGPASLDISYNGQYFQGFGHANYNGATPSDLFPVVSTDGLNWFAVGLDATGFVKPVYRPTEELTIYDTVTAVGYAIDQSADPTWVIDNGKLYLYFTFQAAYLPGEWGGIAMLDPDAWPIPLPAPQTAAIPEGVGGVSAISPTTVTVASAASYTNTTNGLQQLVAIGGSISAATLTRNSVVLTLNAGDQQIMLAPGDKFTPTYTGSPVFNVVQMSA